jgi:formylglycine-generating enzyme required for sulfatase activity
VAKIFISYRREDSQHQADRLHAALSKRIPKRNIFIDVDNIPVGVDFVQHLDQQVGQCDVLLALIGPDWLEAKNPQTGKRRLDDPKDFVRIEIAAALKRGIPVAPVLLDGAPFPPEHKLPEDLKALTRRNGVEVRRMTFDADAERLVRGLELTRAATAAKPAPTRPTTPVRTGGSAFWIGPAVALGMLVLGGGAFAWFGNPGDWRGLGAQTASAVTTDAAPPVSDPVQVAAADPAPAAPDIALPSPSTSTNDPAARSAAVQRIQQSLKTLGQYSGAADGSTGSATRAAAQAFATAQKIVAPDLAAAPISEIDAFAARAEQAALVWTKQEAAAWRVAKDADTRAPLDAYLRDFPNGPNAAAARSRIASMTRPTAPAPTPAVSAPSASSRSAGESFRDCSDCPQMVSIPAGSFTMGSPASETGRDDDEGPQRRVTVPAFAAGRYEVTWAEWDRCVAAGSCASLKADGFGGGSRPVTNVSWNEAVAYAKWLSNKTGQTYRLLSEAEWEYAARAGTTTPFSFGSTISTSQANYDGNYTYGNGSKGDYRQKTTPAGTFSANVFGLHDMHGNVWEWVQDCHAGNYSAGQPSNGSAYTSGSCSYRVDRGGSWYSLPQNLRSASRDGDEPSGRGNLVGFRVARTL